MAVSFILAIAILSIPGSAFPHYISRSSQHTEPTHTHHTGVSIVVPPRPTNTGILPIPDTDHPFIAPGPNDQRGPCPGLNTLANHGYLPRNGIASFGQIVTGLTQGFNMEYEFSASLAAAAILMRGNAFVDRLSIGLHSPHVPPLPGHIDGPVARGLAAHGRFEGDASMTRQDAYIGDNKNFQSDLYAQLLDVVNQFGDNSTVTGPRSIVNVRVMQEFKLKRFMDCQAMNKKFEYTSARLSTSYGEASFTLYFLANGTDGILSVQAMTSFFRDQKFPKDYHRPSVGTVKIIGDKVFEIYNRYPIPSGANNAAGVYVQDFAPFDGCSLYNGLVGANVPAVLLNTTGLLKQNVNLLLDIAHRGFPDCPVVIPSAPANM